MIVTANDKPNMSGHLQISKVVNGNEEVVFDDKNVIVSGFGWGLAYLFSKLGSETITDFQIDRFQLGVSGSLANQVSSTFELSGPLSSASSYIGLTADSNLFVLSAAQYKNGTTVTSPNPWFGLIPYAKVTKINETSVRYTIFVDEDSCNDLTLNEIGLFMKNPRGSTPEESVLVAYKYFTNIQKTSDFGLLFRWTITLG